MGLLNNILSAAAATAGTAVGAASAAIEIAAESLFSIFTLSKKEV